MFRLFVASLLALGLGSCKTKGRKAHPKLLSGPNTLEIQHGIKTQTQYIRCPEGTKSIIDGKCHTGSLVKASNKICKNGIYNHTLNMCVSDQFTCPQGSYKKDGACYKDMICPEGSVMTDNGCITDPICDSGRNKDGKCIGEISCPDGSEYDTENNACLADNKYLCPNGWDYDKGENACKPKSFICPRNSIKKGHKCINKKLLCDKGFTAVETSSDGEKYACMTKADINNVCEEEDFFLFKTNDDKYFCVASHEKIECDDGNPATLVEDGGYSSYECRYSLD